MNPRISYQNINKVGEVFNPINGRRIETVVAAYLERNNGDLSHSDIDINDSNLEELHHKNIFQVQNRQGDYSDEEDFKDAFILGNFAATEQIQNKGQIVLKRKSKNRLEMEHNEIKEIKSESIINYKSANQMKDDINNISNNDQSANENGEGDQGQSGRTPNESGRAISGREISNKRLTQYKQRKVKRKPRYPKPSGQQTDQIEFQQILVPKTKKQNTRKKSTYQINKIRQKTPNPLNPIKIVQGTKIGNSGVSEQPKSGETSQESSFERPKPVKQDDEKYKSAVSINNKHRVPRNYGQSRLGQKAFEIAEKIKNNIINFSNIFVLDNGKPYTESYKVIKKIGQGGCGEVFMVMHLATDQIRAMKVINKLTDKVVKTIYDELNVLKSLDHPGIVKVFDYYQDEKNLYVIMEYLKGGNVFDRIKVIGRFGERESAYIMKQILQALNYCADQRIVHRDLKLENILFSHEEQLQVKIIDFGSAINLEKYSPKKTNRIITSYYVAPEIINKEENIIKCDVWSAGVILFILLSGSLPFKGNNDNEIFDKVVKGTFNFEDSQWKFVTSRAKFLIKDMLDVNVYTRATLFKCIESPWIKMLTKIDDSFRIDASRLQKAFTLMSNFQPICKFRILMLHFSLNYFHFEPQTSKLSRVFSYMDQRQIACLNTKEILKFAIRIFRDTDQAELKEKQEEIVQKLDFRKQGGIGYSDFLIACLDFQKLLSYQKLTKMFQMVDKDNDGYISIKDLHNFTSKVLPMEQCHSIIRECLHILESSNDKDHSICIGDVPDIPSDQMRLRFSQFKSIVLNQGLNIRDPSLINKGFKNQTSPHLLMGAFNSQTPGSGHEKNQSNNQVHSQFVVIKEEFRSPKQQQSRLAQQPEAFYSKRESSNQNEKYANLKSFDASQLIGINFNKQQSLANPQQNSHMSNNNIRVHQQQFSGGANAVQIPQNNNITTDDSKDPHQESSLNKQRTQKSKRVKRDISQKKLVYGITTFTKKQIQQQQSLEK